jgi:hypothetical protein
VAKQQKACFIPLAVLRKVLQGLGAYIDGGQKGTCNVKDHLKGIRIVV